MSLILTFDNVFFIATKNFFPSFLPSFTIETEKELQYRRNNFSCAWIESMLSSLLLEGILIQGWEERELKTGPNIPWRLKFSFPVEGRDVVSGAIFEGLKSHTADAIIRPPWRNRIKSKNFVKTQRQKSPFKISSRELMALRKLGIMAKRRIYIHKSVSWIYFAKTVSFHEIYRHFVYLGIIITFILCIRRQVFFFVLKIRFFRKDLAKSVKNYR